MTDIPLLHSLFLKRTQPDLQDVGISLFQLLSHNELSSHNLDETIEQFKCPQANGSLEVTFKNWKSLLELNLLNSFINGPENALALRIRELEKQPWNQNSQQLRILVCLNHLLAKMPTPEIAPSLLESGAALMDISEYTPWLSLPYHPEHLEFGVFLALLAKLTQKQAYNDILTKLANWQLNTLKDNFIPFPSLYSTEQKGSPISRLIISYLFFYSSASLINNALFSQAAALIARQIADYAHEMQISPLWVLIEKMFAPPLMEVSNHLKLPQRIYDPSTALAGHRSNDCFAVATLHGGYTGLGCMGNHDVELINYGPQYFPLDDCKGFGIEGNYLADHDLRKTIIETSKEGFTIKGCARLVDQPVSSSPFFPIHHLGSFKGIWLELAQEFKAPQLKISLSLLGLDSWENIAFSFFVKANSCLIDGQKRINKSSFEKYNGPVSNLKLLGEKSRLEFTAKDAFHHLEVIPLEGRNSFWGANFLIAYVLDPQNKHYSWTVKLSPPI